MCLTQLSRPLVPAEQLNSATAFLLQSVADGSASETEIPPRRRSRRSVSAQTAAQRVVRHAAQCRRPFGPVSPRNYSCSKHLQVGSASLCRQAQDLALRPTVCARQSIDLMDEPLPLRCDLNPEKMRDIEKQFPMLSTIRAV